MDGLALGAEDYVTDIILELREQGIYRARQEPQKIKEGHFTSVRKAIHAG